MKPALRLVVLLTFVTSLSAHAQTAPPAPDGTASFVVLRHGTQIGTASASVTRTPAGWSIEGATRLDAPLDVTVNRVEVGYTTDWAPRNATLDLATRGETVVVHGGGFGGPDPARIDIVRGGRQVTFVTADVPPGALILPNYAYAAYEALALRLESAAAGSLLSVYVLPQRAFEVRVDAVTGEQLRGRRVVATRHYRLTFLDPSGETTADLWAETGRLARFDIPSQELSVVRVDLASR